MGGVRKADLVVGDRRLLDVVLGACRDCSPIVVVGDADLAVPRGVVVTREDPPYSGPAAALAAGLAVIHERGVAPDWVLCLGCDQPGAPEAVAALLRAAAEAPADIDAVSASPAGVRPGTAGDGDRIEWVTAMLRTVELEKAIASRGTAGVVDTSMRRLLAPLRWAHAPVSDHATDDIDTWEDHARWQRRLETT